MDNLNKKKIGIIRGGIGKHYIHSLKRGSELILHILESLSHKYKPVDILIDKEGVWHSNGIPIKLTDLKENVDLVWNILQHPSLSPILEDLPIKKIGHNTIHKILENNEDKLSTHIKIDGIKIPRSIILPLYQKDFDGDINDYSIKKAKEIFEKFSSPWIVKSFVPDSSMGIHLAKNFPELVSAIFDGVKHNKNILIEEFISGKPIVAHSVTKYRGEDVYIFPINNLAQNEKERLIQLIRKIHTHLNIENYLKTDFVLHPSQGIFLTKVEFLPDLRKGSHFDEACNVVGAKMHEVIENIIENVLN